MRPGSLLVSLMTARTREVLRQRERVRRTGGRAAVHDLRVATRRLQESLEFFEPFLPPRQRRRLDRRARRIRRSLGEVRNADVVVELVRGLRRRAGARHEALLAATVARLAAEAAALRRPAAGRRGLPVAGVRRRVRAFLRRLPRSMPAAPRGRAREVIASRLRNVRVALAGAAMGRADAVHRLRITIKRYRYALEIVAAAGLADVRAPLERARSLQSALGELRDRDVLIELVRRGAGGPAGALLLRPLRDDRRTRLDAVLRDLRVLRRTRLSALAIDLGREDAAA